MNKICQRSGCFYCPYWVLSAYSVPSSSLSSKTFPSPSLRSPESTFHMGVLFTSETEHQAISACFYNTSFLFFSVGKLRSFQRPGPLLIFLVETSLRPFWIGRLMYSPVPGMPQRLYPKLLGPSLGLLCKVRGWRPYKSHFQSRFCKALGLPPKRFAS